MNSLAILANLHLHGKKLMKQYKNKWENPISLMPAFYYIFLLYLRWFTMTMAYKSR